MTADQASSTATTIICAIRRVRIAAVAAGAISSAKTSRAPTVWNEDTTARATSASRPRWVSPGRRPSSSA